MTRWARCYGRRVREILCECDAQMSESLLVPATPLLTRRGLLFGGAAFAVAAPIGGDVRAAAPAPTEMMLTASAGRWPLFGKSAPSTDVWCYDGKIPGPTLRVRQGKRISITVRNALPEDTTVH